MLSSKTCLPCDRHKTEHCSHHGSPLTTNRDRHVLEQHCSFQMNFHARARTSEHAKRAQIRYSHTCVVNAVDDGRTDGVQVVYERRQGGWVCRPSFILCDQVPIDQPKRPPPKARGRLLSVKASRTSLHVWSTSEALHEIVGPSALAHDARSNYRPRLYCKEQQTRRSADRAKGHNPVLYSHTRRAPDMLTPPPAHPPRLSKRT
jgi:hypothetical protein